MNEKQTRIRKSGIQLLARPRVLLLLSATSVIFVSFQNFTTLSAEQLAAEQLGPDFAARRASSPNDGTGDIRLIAPYRVTAPDDPVFAPPGSGHDLNSIGQDWASRQAKIITGGADERFLNDLNKKLNRMVSSSDEEEIVDTGDGVAVTGASSDGHHSVATETSDFFGLRPRSFRVLSLNRMSMGLANKKTQISCQFQGQSMQLDLTHPIAKGLDINLRHETSLSKSTVLINYTW